MGYSQDSARNPIPLSSFQLLLRCFQGKNDKHFLTTKNSQKT
jgi:hypothetical protein